MSINNNIDRIVSKLPNNVTLIAVSKTYPAEDIQEAYNGGQRDFGENKPQEMTAKQAILPNDIRWHQIGTLQTNKVKYIAPYVYMIHSVDSEKLLKIIQKEGAKNSRVINILFEVKVANEDSKHGWDMYELKQFVETIELGDYPNITFRGVMGMATFTDDAYIISQEFKELKDCYDSLSTKFITFDTLSMGMSQDYKLAIEQGSTMVRVGTAIFGARNYNI